MIISINRQQFKDTEPIPPYQRNGPFAWSIRCPECEMEKPHSEEVHNVYAFGWSL